MVTYCYFLISLFITFLGISHVFSILHHFCTIAPVVLLIQVVFFLGSILRVAFFPGFVAFVWLLLSLLYVTNRAHCLSFTHRHNLKCNRYLLKAGPLIPLSGIMVDLEMSVTCSVYRVWDNGQCSLFHRLQTKLELKP